MLEDEVPPSVSLLTVQFLGWLADRPRTYADVMAAWRSTCPRMSVWEDCVIAGLVRYEGGRGRTVTLTPDGRAIVERNADDGACRAPRTEGGTEKKEMRAL